MKRVNYTAKTLEALRAFGAECQVVEKWKMIPGHPGGGVRSDLFGFIDIISLACLRIVGVQSTSHKQRTPHRKTIMEKVESWNWCRHTGIILLITHKKLAKPEPGTRNRWVLKVDEFRLSNDGESVIASGSFDSLLSWAKDRYE